MGIDENRLSMRTDSAKDLAGVHGEHLIFNRFSFFSVLASIAGLAFILRLLNVLQTFEVPILNELLGDARGYYEWALRIRDGDWYGTETFYQAPLYPYFLGAIIKAFGPSITIIRLVQAILGTLGVALIGLGLRKLFSAKTALIAAFMLATYPPSIYYDGIIQKTSLATFLLCALLTTCAVLQSKPRCTGALGVGLALGLLVLTRENALIWIPLIPCWIAVVIRGAVSHRLKFIGCYTAGLLMVLLPIAARNASLGGEWSPTTFQAGTNFYIGNNSGANGIYIPLVPGHGTPMYERYDAQEIAERETGRQLSSREVSQFWMSKAWHEIRQDPSHWFQLLIAKTFMVLNRYEVPDVENLYIFSENSVALKPIKFWHFGILCPLGVWGLLTTWKDRQKLWLLYVLLLTMIAAVVLFFILGRYRNPVAILFIPFASAGLLDLWECITQKRWPKKRLISAALASAVLCNLTVHEEQSLQASSYMNMGISACKMDDLTTGIRLLEKAVNEFPEMAEGYSNLGRAYMLNGQLTRAARCFEIALTIDPRLNAARSQLNELLEILERE